MNQEKIIQAIAAYLEENTIAVQDATVWHLQFKKEIDKLFLTKTAREIAAAIAPNLEAGAGWEGVPDEYKYRTVDRDGMVCYWDKEPMAYGGSWVSQESPTKSMVRKTRFDWESTLERRPR